MALVYLRDVGVKRTRTDFPAMSAPDSASDFAKKIQQLTTELSSSRSDNAKLEASQRELIESATTTREQLDEMQAGVRTQRETFWNSKIADFLNTLRENSDTLDDKFMGGIHDAFVNPNPKFTAFSDFIRVAHAAHTNSRSELQTQLEENRGLRERLATLDAPPVAAVSTVHDGAFTDSRKRFRSDSGAQLPSFLRTSAPVKTVHSTALSSTQSEESEALLNEIFRLV
jgi:chaperonin cofactor prefoldin